MSNYSITKVDFSELSEHEINPNAGRSIAERFCIQNKVVLLGDLNSEGPVKIGALNLDADGAFQKLTKLVQRDITVYQLNEYEITKALEEIFRPQGNKDKKDVFQISETSSIEMSEKNVVKLIENILGHAVFMRASDIHIERYREDVDVRFRIDGVLHQIATPLSPLTIDQCVSRIKIMCELDISKSSEAQDGRIDTIVKRGSEKEEVFFRVATIPGKYGEDVVLRILKYDDSLGELDDLGLGTSKTAKLKELLNNPEGMIIVSGPTGSGKTTTLYTSLAQISDSTKKILSVEDPIERDLPKVNQKEISKRMDFSDYAKAFLRQDPNVILIGEIRDNETAEMAIRASHNGSLVMASIHTADSLRTLSRLHALGADWDLLLNSVLGIINQRLLRKVCQHCKKEVKPTKEQYKLLHLTEESGPFYMGEGCSKCNKIGYAGRIGVYEMLVLNDDIIAALKAPDNVLKVKKALLNAGFKTLFDDAFKKAKLGQTTLEEIIRCVPYRILNQRK